MATLSAPFVDESSKRFKSSEEECTLQQQISTLETELSVHHEQQERVARMALEAQSGMVKLVTRGIRAEVQDELNKLKENADESRKELITKQDEFKQLQDQLKKSSSDTNKVQTLQLKIRDLQQKNERLLDEKERHRNDARLRLDTDLSDITMQRNKYKARVKELERRDGQGDLRGKIKELTEKDETSNLSILKLKERIKELQVVHKPEDAERRVTEMQQRAVDAERRVTELQQSSVECNHLKVDQGLQQELKNEKRESMRKSVDLKKQRETWKHRYKDEKQTTRKLEGRIQHLERLLPDGNVQENDGLDFDLEVAQENDGLDFDLDLELEDTPIHDEAMAAQGVTEEVTFGDFDDIILEFLSDMQEGN